VLLCDRPRPKSSAVSKKTNPHRDNCSACEAHFIHKNLGRPPSKVRRHFSPSNNWANRMNWLEEYPPLFNSPPGA